jgi:hypothetical protein
VYILDQEEVNQLIDASQAPYVEPPSEFEQVEYASYIEEEVQALIDGVPYRRKRKKKAISETTNQHENVSRSTASPEFPSSS